MNNLKITIAAFVMGVVFSAIITNNDTPPPITIQNTNNPNNMYFSYDDPEKLYSMNFGTKTINITWKTVSNPNKKCNSERARLGMQPFNTEVLACSIWNDDTCTIYTAKNVNMHTGGHEMFHCLMHAYHPE